MSTGFCHQEKKREHPEDAWGQFPSKPLFHLSGSPYARIHKKWGSESDPRQILIGLTFGSVLCTLIPEPYGFGVPSMVP